MTRRDSGAGSACAILRFAGDAYGATEGGAEEFAQQIIASLERGDTLAAICSRRAHPEWAAIAMPLVGRFLLLRTTPRRRPRLVWPGDLQETSVLTAPFGGTLIGALGHRHDVDDELARMERLCLELAEESRVHGKAEALRGDGRKLRSRVCRMDRRRLLAAAQAERPSNISEVVRPLPPPNSVDCSALLHPHAERSGNASQRGQFGECH